MSTILSRSPECGKHFYSLTQVPRPSGYFEESARVLAELWKKCRRRVIQDEAGNIIYRKPATPGWKTMEKVILQAHMDMVPQKKNNDTVHDFENDPIKDLH